MEKKLDEKYKEKEKKLKEELEASDDEFADFVK